MPLGKNSHLSYVGYKALSWRRKSLLWLTSAVGSTGVSSHCGGAASLCLRACWEAFLNNNHIRTTIVSIFWGFRVIIVRSCLIWTTIIICTFHIPLLAKIISNSKISTHGAFVVFIDKYRVEKNLSPLTFCLLISALILSTSIFLADYVMPYFSHFSACCW